MNHLVDDIVTDLHFQGMLPMQIFRRLVPVFGSHVASHAIAMHAMRLRIIRAIEEGEEEEEDPINIVIEHTLQTDESVPTPAKLKLVPSKKPLQENCVICMDDKIQVPVTLPCNHSFCHKCIRQWFLEKNTCPTCRICVDKPPSHKRKREQAPNPRRLLPRRRLNFRARPRCRRCRQLMRGHPRGPCIRTGVNV